MLCGMEKLYLVPPHLVEKAEALLARVKRGSAADEHVHDWTAKVDSSAAPLQPESEAPVQHPSVLRRIFAQNR